MTDRSAPTTDPVSEPAVDTASSRGDLFAEIVRGRRSVRRFDDTPIPETTMRRCLELALLAPNSSNLQPWELHWVRTDDNRRRLVHACLGQQAARTATELVVVVSRTATWRRNARLLLDAIEARDGRVKPIVRRYYRRIVPALYTPGPLNLLGGLKWLVTGLVGLWRPLIRGPYTHAGMRRWATKSCALAAAQLMLALRAEGFDSCPMEGMDARRVARLLDLPRDARVEMVIGAGKGRPDGVYDQRWRLPSTSTIVET